MERVVIENAKLIFRNFEGAVSQYNRDGNRSFGVLLDREVADKMIDDGWNVKELPEREEGDDPQPWLQVKVNTKNSIPVINLVTKKGITRLYEDTLKIIDSAEIEICDLIISPYEWNVNGKSGVSAYLYQAYITIRETDLDSKYRELGY